ncbi:MAG: DUF883 family protein [Rhodocyclaceae bacterium]|nr:DUF883 family protein [Rhodocyclaceae bacterium]
MKDLKRVVGDADDLLHELASAGTEELATARTRIEASLGEVEASLRAARRAFARQARIAADATNEYVRKNPWKLVGIVTAAGLLAALLLSRR